MPSLDLNIQYKYADELQVSVMELITDWMHGIPLKDSAGRFYPFSSIRKKILAAQTFVENIIQRKLIPTEIEEKKDYNREEFANWGHVKVQYPITEIVPQLVDGVERGIVGAYINNKQIGYPIEWLTARGRNIAMVPNSVGSQNIIITGFGAFPTLAGISKTVPDYWIIKYKTGWQVLPADVSAVIAKLAVIYVFSIVGDVLRPIGVASQSLSIDGLSQSISNITNSQGNALSPRIIQYTKEITEDLKTLKNNYTGILFDVL